MKKIILSLFAAVSFVSAAFAQNSTDEIFNKFFDATGGKDLWNNVSTYTIKQILRNNSASDFDQNIVASLPDQSMSKTKSIMKRDFVYGIAGNDGWLKVPLGSSDKNVKYDTKDLSDKEKDNMRRELKDLILPFLSYETKGYISSFVATEANLNHIELSGKGIKYDLYFDTTTGLLSREKQTLSTGEIITKEYTKYAQSTYGVSYPSEGTLISSIDKRNFKVTTTMTFNDKLDISSFKR
jgi:hypothetical protein